MIFLDWFCCWRLAKVAIKFVAVKISNGLAWLFTGIDEGLVEISEIFVGILLYEDDDWLEPNIGVESLGTKETWAEIVLFVLALFGNNTSLLGINDDSF